MSCKLEPAIWSHDTGQQIPYFDRCQLIITWMSDIKEVHGKPRLHVSVKLFSIGVWPPCWATPPPSPSSSSSSCVRAYAYTSNTASHGTHEKINSWVPFSSLIWVWGSAWRPSAAGAPLLHMLMTNILYNFFLLLTSYSLILLKAFLVTQYIMN